MKSTGYMRLKRVLVTGALFDCKRSITKAKKSDKKDLSPTIETLKTLNDIELLISCGFAKAISVKKCVQGLLSEATELKNTSVAA